LREERGAAAGAAGALASAANPLEALLNPRFGLLRNALPQSVLPFELERKGVFDVNRLRLLLFLEDVRLAGRVPFDLNKYQQFAPLINTWSESRSRLNSLPSVLEENAAFWDSNLAAFRESFQEATGLRIPNVRFIPFTVFHVNASCF
jgi:hypothetical protein